MNMRRLMGCLGMLASLVLTGATAAEPAMRERAATRVAANPDEATRRVALVVGNSTYRKEKDRLPNPVLDAEAMNKALGKLGFEVVKETDASRTRMVAALARFRDKARGAAVAVVYYAGHGIQMDGQNYLIPVDADMEQVDSVKYNTVSLQQMLDDLEQSGARMKIVILDACRDNPFEQRGRGGGSGGLAAIGRAAEGTLIAYATSPGRTALDGRQGENGLYTSHLLKAMAMPGLGIEEVFKQTRLQVAEASRGRQIPWETTSLVGNLVLLPGAAEAPPASGLILAAAAQGGGMVTRSVARAEKLAVGQTFRDCDAAEQCPQMVVLPAGGFTMGSPVDERERHPGEGPQQRIEIPRPFAVGVYEVSFAEWERCLLEGGCRLWPADQGWGRGKRPVINVSWEDAEDYVRWLSRKTGRKYRLPSEAEWEYAARAGSGGARPWGAEIVAGRAHCLNCGEASGERGPREVGRHPPNAWGVHDVLGNVWEWVADCQNADLQGVSGQAPRLQGECAWRGIRGGSWTTAAKGVRSAARGFYPVSRRADNIGFRVAADVE